MGSLRIAAICATYNEEILLPQYLAHYGSCVDRIFILDNESNDRTREIAAGNPKVTLSTYSSGGEFRDTALSAAYDGARAACAGKFDYVIIADCDEFILSKDGRSIREILTAYPGREFYATHGFNMWAHASEAKYDPAMPMLWQRAHGIESIRYYSKPAIIRPESSLKYTHGRHEFSNWSDPSLKDPLKALFYLLHFLGFDEENYVQRMMMRVKRFSAENERLGISYQYYKRTEESLRAEFRRNARESVRVLILS